MEQSKIMELLIQASDPVNRRDRNRTGAALTQEIFTNGVRGDEEDFGWHEGLRAVLEELFQGALEHAYYLPRLFPAFAYASGDREDGRSATIDWDIALAQLPSARTAYTIEQLASSTSVQAPILRLLMEASHPGCSVERWARIHVELGSLAEPDDGTAEGTGRHEAFAALLGMVFVEALRHAPHILPYLFPIFATLCGEREEGVIIAEVDWVLALAL